jgi:hypothetical protein
MVMKIRVAYTGNFFFYHFERLLVCLIKQQKILGEVTAEYEADNGDSSMGNLDE